MCCVEACGDMLNIQPSMHLRWMKQAQTMIDERKRMNVRARSIHVHDFLAALHVVESNASNQETGNKDSPLTTLSP